MCPSSSARGPASGPYKCLHGCQGSDCLGDELQDSPTAVGASDGEGGFGGAKGNFCAANVSIDEERFEYQLEDQRIASSAISHLRLAKQLAGGRPFFVGAGFHKPHLPWHFPAGFLQHFPKALEEIPLAKDCFAPIDMPLVAWHSPPSQLNQTFNMSYNGNATRSRLYRRAYYASVAYTDYNIGRLLDELDALDVTNDTVALMFGDHGWQLGEHNLWAKMTMFEAATRVPFIVRAPWMTASVGATTWALTEMVDVFPTLAALAGLPDPLSEGEGINGTSLIPLFENPEGSVKDAAFSQFSKCGGLCPNTCYLRHDCPPASAQATCRPLVVFIIRRGLIWQVACDLSRTATRSTTARRPRPIFSRRRITPGRGTASISARATLVRRQPSWGTRSARATGGTASGGSLSPTMSLIPSARTYQRWEWSCMRTRGMMETWTGQARTSTWPRGRSTRPSSRACGRGCWTTSSWTKEPRPRQAIDFNLKVKQNYAFILQRLYLMSPRFACRGYHHLGRLMRHGRLAAAADLILLRRRHTLQVHDEVVPHTPHGVRSTHTGVVCVGHHQHVEILHQRSNTLAPRVSTRFQLVGRIALQVI